ncbi:hypothetical protein ACFPPD_03625 [Cohnella suwonensis]|uniref:Uncharacterized protein n=1 Tax=Cohnella suwonensis TaxID=696072 RepID=A0ABW0LPW1_9BACL
MSPLYGSAFLWLLAAVLWWSGWREEPDGRVPRWAVGVFLAGWPFLLRMDIPTPFATINGAWAWTLSAVCVLAWKTPGARRWTALSSGVLLGAVYLLFGRLASYPGGYPRAATLWLLAAMIGWMASLFLRAASDQTLAISVAFYSSVGLMAFVKGTDVAAHPFWATEWTESWWTAVLAARLWTIGVDAAAEKAGRWIPRWGSRRGG